MISPDDNKFAFFAYIPVLPVFSEKSIFPEWFIVAIAEVNLAVSLSTYIPNKPDVPLIPFINLVFAIFIFLSQFDSELVILFAPQIPTDLVPSWISPLFVRSEFEAPNKATLFFVIGFVSSFIIIVPLLVASPKSTAIAVPPSLEKSIIPLFVTTTLFLFSEPA